MKYPFERKEIFGVKITSASMDDILKYIIRSLSANDTKVSIVTPNPEIIMYAAKHPEFRDILNQAQISTPDGIGVILAGKVLGEDLIGRITGIDLMEKLCREVSKKPITIGLLGGRGNVAEETANCLRKRYPGLKISYVGGEWDEAKLKGKNIDILFVAFGFPKQEEWIYENLYKIPVKVAVGVGGSFDYLSGRVSRAPKILRLIGLEWMYRLVSQPWRIKRQLVLIEFIYLTFILTIKRVALR